MPEAVSPVKNPARVAAGRASAERRWRDHPPNVIAIEDLTPEQRFLVRRLVEAVRSAPAVVAAAPAHNEP